MADTAKRQQPEQQSPFMWAFLVTDYFSMENRLKAPVKWRARRIGGARLAQNRRRLASLREAFGISVHGRQFVAE